MARKDRTLRACFRRAVHFWNSNEPSGFDRFLSFLSRNSTVCDSESASVSRNPLRRLYDWTLSWADTPHGQLALFVLAFTEATFFPVPPDVLLIALVLGARTKAFRLAAVCTGGSL